MGLASTRQRGATQVSIKNCVAREARLRAGDRKRVFTDRQPSRSTTWRRPSFGASGPHEVEHLAKSPGGVTRARLQLDAMTSSSVGPDAWSPPEPSLGSLLSWRGVDGRKPAVITAGSSSQLVE